MPVSRQESGAGRNDRRLRRSRPRSRRNRREWEISSPHPLIEPDAELNDRLRAAGFSHDQAQLVYELAAERLLPVISDALGGIEAQRQADRLQQRFGGSETWGRTARQIRSWAQAHLNSGVSRRWITVKPVEPAGTYFWP